MEADGKVTSCAIFKLNFDLMTELDEKTKDH